MQDKRIEKIRQSLSRVCAVMVFVLMCGLFGWGQTLPVDGHVYLINLKSDGKHIYPNNNGDIQVSPDLGDYRYWFAETVNVGNESYYRFKSIKRYLNNNNDHSYIYANPDGNPTEAGFIRYETIHDTNPTDTKYLFKLVAHNGSFAVIPYRLYNDANYNTYSWYKSRDYNNIGVCDYDAGGNASLWDFQEVSVRYELTDPLIGGPAQINSTGTYAYGKGADVYFKVYVNNVQLHSYNSGITYTWSASGLPESGTIFDNGNVKRMIVSEMPSTPTVVTLTCEASKTMYGQSLASTCTLTVMIGTPTPITSLSDLGSSGYYILNDDIADASGYSTIETFTGFFDGNFHKINGLDKPLFGTMDNATIRNVILDNVNINVTDGNGDAGAIAKLAKGNSRIYNCGILATSGSTVSGTRYVGGLVGKIEDCSRVVNCYSFANITSGMERAGLVGYNSFASSQDEVRTMVVNCMFYGDISSGGTIRPVYGGERISNTIYDDGSKGINLYDFYRDEATFDDNYGNIADYYNSWPAEERFLTRFEYYRSLLNGNRHLCVWWIIGQPYGYQRTEDVEMVAKWVLDPSIAKYPILKKHEIKQVEGNIVVVGKYPSVINRHPDSIWDERNNNWVLRSAAKKYEGRIISELGNSGFLTVTVNAGNNNTTAAAKTLSLPILDMDTVHNDYCYAKVQLPYYNEQFGNPSSNDHVTRYGKNYTDKVVTGWKITKINGSATGTGNFVADWQNGYDFADRTNTNKDLYSVSGRVFAQGGNYYVPDGVTSIEIEAYWGDAVYLHNSDHYMDKINLAREGFLPAGALPSSTSGNNQTFNGRSVETSISNAIGKLQFESAGKTVYDQAIVLVGNYQFLNTNSQGNMGWSTQNTIPTNENLKPFTWTCVDLDFDNEPDYCLELQYGHETTRINIHPVRFDFLPIVGLGYAMKQDSKPYACGIFIPRGHFEVTETTLYYTTEFEYDGHLNYPKKEAPLILNGGQYEQIVTTVATNGNMANHTNYIVMGGNIWMKVFSPGAHGDKRQSLRPRLCAVSVLGGEYEEFYLSGMFNDTIKTDLGNPHCYINGGKFGLMAGSGMERVNGDVTYKIDHARIGEFYGGGINANMPVQGSIFVTVNNSIVDYYCGGPKTGNMLPNTQVITNATGTTFGRFFGGGNGGTNYVRVWQWDNTIDGGTSYTPNMNDWNTNGKFNVFSPLTYVDYGQNNLTGTGYQAQFEFELMNHSGGDTDKVVARSYRWDAQFSMTEVQQVTSTLTDCTVKFDFYGAGNLSPVLGNVTSTLNNTKVYGSAYGGGFSAEIPTFIIHDKTTVSIPTRSIAGVCYPGSLDYVKDNGVVRKYKWVHDPQADYGITGITGLSTSNPVIQYPPTVGQWYCYTEHELTNLGVVHGNTILNVNGSTKIYGSSTLVNGEPQAPFDGAAFGGGNMADVWGNSTVNVNGTDGENGLLVSNVFGGGNIATTGRSDSETVNCSKVVLYGGTIGVVNEETLYHYDNSGSVYGGGKGAIDGIRPDHSNILEIINEGRVYGNSQVEIRGGKVLNNVFGGGQYASVGSVDASGAPVMANGDYRDGSVTVTVLGGEVGPLDMTGLNAYVYGGGEGVPDDLDDDYVNFANVNNTVVTVNMPMDDAEHNRVWGSLFGGSADGHVLGDAQVNLVSGTIGTDGTTSWDGNIFGGGRNYTYANITAGRVGGNIIVNMTGGLLKGSIFGGGRMGNTGIDAAGVMQEDENSKTYGHVDVNVSGGTVGTSTHAQTIGNVFGGGKGLFFDEDQLANVVNWAELGMVKMTHVNIYGDARIHGSVYGGGEIARVEDSTFVEVKGGIIGTAYGTQGQTGYQHFGSVYGGGQGYRREEPVSFYGYDYYVDLGSQSTGRVGKNTRVEMSGGQVMENVYGGGRIASVGPIEMDYGIYSYNAPPVPLTDENGNYVDGHATVIITGGQVGPLDMTGLNGYVYGGSKGRDSDPDSQYTDFSNVHTTVVTVNMPMTEGNRVWGSLFGGGADGHVLGDAEVNLISGTIGTDGTTSWDGNIFGGGRNYLHTNMTAGRVGGNITINMTGGWAKGSVFGGGRMGLTGIDAVGDTIAGLDHGYVTVNISGGQVGYATETYDENINKTIGHVFGGGKGIVDPAVGLWPHLAKVKGTSVNISQDEGNTTRIYGSVYGGGETAPTLNGSHVKIEGGIIGTEFGEENVDCLHKGSVYGGGKGTSNRSFLVNNIPPCNFAGQTLGKVEVEISGGQVLENVFGGGQIASVGDTIRNRICPVTVTITGGEVGPLDMTGFNGYVYGGGEGVPNDVDNFYRKVANVDSTMVMIDMPLDDTLHNHIYGSVFGGAADGHVLGNARVVFEDGLIGTSGKTSWDGNIFGGGRNYSGSNKSAGRVGGNVNIVMTGGWMKGCIYGGGRLGSVGVDWLGDMQTDGDGKTYGYVNIKVKGGTVGNENNWEQDHTTSGNVYGGGMGRLTKLDGTNNTIWPFLALVKQTDIKVSQTNDDNPTVINNSVYGGGELGTVEKDATITVESGSIMRDIYGGGYGSNSITNKGNISISGAPLWITPMQLAGRVGGNTSIGISGGWVRKSVYGGGEFATVGIITDSTAFRDENTSFALSWPYKFDYATNTGAATINITGGRIGITGSDYVGPTDAQGQPINPTTGEPLTAQEIDDAEVDNGDVYGGGKGFAENRYLEAHCANVYATIININYPTSNQARPENYKDLQALHDCITGSVYGGGENGHVNTDAKITLTYGLIGHALYGGGKGKDKFEAMLKNWVLDPNDPQGWSYSGESLKEIYSITAGKVYGNTEVNVNGGYVVRNVFGGGNLASVGKGNYANDAYRPEGYGEKVSESNTELWEYANNSGKTKVTIKGGKLGYLDPNDPPIKDKLPYGNVFGGCRGTAVPEVPRTLTPRFDYCPEDFLGYCNNTEVIIGDVACDSIPRVYGSAYGGAMDGHVRYDTEITLNKGKIGAQYGVEAVSNNPEDDLNSIVWKDRGNVYGAGSGIGTYKDKNNNNAVRYSNIGGSVTHFVTVNINGGQVYRNVYGGGDLATVGPPRITQSEDCPKTMTMVTVNVNSLVGQEGVEEYGGNVFGGSRGKWDFAYDFGNFAFCPYTEVNINPNAVVANSVYGGGELGPIGVASPKVESKHDTEVNIKGVVGAHVFGGGKGLVVDPESIENENIMDSLVAKVYGSTVVVVNRQFTPSPEQPEEGVAVGGSVFGGGEDGMVWCNTNVMIKNGIIGVDESENDSPEIGNVFGGGRGKGQYEKVTNSNTGETEGVYVETAGMVEGNSSVTIEGGHINGNVYGGGELASVGRMLDKTHADPNTGWARVKISSGVIGTDTNLDDEHGLVFGASRGIAGEDYKDFAYVNNTLVTLTSPPDGSNLLAPVVKGGLFGSGDDGHVMFNTQVTVNSNGGSVGVPEVLNENKGNVYGGGRGVNRDANNNLSPTAGLVNGHTKVNISNGDVYGSVFGGGKQSAVVQDKLVNVYDHGIVHGNVYGGSKTVPDDVDNNTGLKTVNVRDADCHIYGSVYGCSYNTIDGEPNPEEGHEKDRTAFVNINGGTIDGNVYGAGYSGEVNGSVSVAIGSNAFSYTDNGTVVKRDEQNIRFNDSGGIPIVTIVNITDIDTDHGTATLTGFLVDEGAPRPSRYRGFCWSTSPHPTIGDGTTSTVIQQGFDMGQVGNYSMSVSSNSFVSGTTYYVRAFAMNGFNIPAYSPEMKFKMQAGGKLELVEQPTNDPVRTYAPVPNKLVIGGSVYGGSDHVGSDPNQSHWNTYDITGYSYILIDGTGYDTENDETTKATSSGTDPYFNIGGGLYGSGTHCESGAMGREIFLNNYGVRNAGDEFTQATRTLTTIQRCDYALLANSNVNLSGDVDISGHDQRNYAVLLVDKGLYMAEASALSLGAVNHPAYMDSIHMVRSVLLRGATYNDPVEFWENTIDAENTWDWIGIQGDTPQTASLYRISTANNSTTTTLLSKAQENVIIFNGDSRMWVRYHERKDGDTEVKQYYGELNGFFRMKSPFLPYGTKSFAYARPKMTLLNKDANSEADERNKGDGGFLSYETVKNFHTQTIDNPDYISGNDGGDEYTQTKQYPYTNVMELSSKGEIVDMTQYREWVIRKPLGKNWYVDGTRGWGKDLMRPVGDEIGNDDFNWKYNWGRYPDKPKQTISGPEGVFAGTYSGVDDKMDFHYKDNIVYYTQQDQQQGLIPEGYSVGDINPNETYYQDAVYVVGPLDGIKECVDNNSYTNSNGHTLLPSFVNLEPDYNLILLRYPGGHEMSNTKTDKTNVAFNTMPTQGSGWTGAATNSETGPGANYDALMNVQDRGIVLDNVYMDGLYGNNGFDFAANVINPTYFHLENVMRPLVVTIANSNLTMKGGSTLTGGCNNIDGAVWYNNSDYTGNELHGGAVYVDASATVNVEGIVSITGNKQKNGANVIESNVYLPTFAKHVNITNDLTGSSIGITSPIRNAQSRYTFNTFSPIAVGVREGYEKTDAENAWKNNNFYDDLDWFFYKGGDNHEKRTTYYSDNIDDYPGCILESEATSSPYIFPNKTLFFGWTWANIVRQQPTDFAHENIDSAEDLAWVISEVNGLNGQTDGHNLEGVTVEQTADFDLQQYVWVPIGANMPGAMPFSGQYDGRGHLITNMDIDYIGSNDCRYNYTDFGLFGYVTGDANNTGVVNRTFVVSGLIRPEGTANMGGLVGKMHGANALVSNSEAAVHIVCPNSSSEVGAGGLVGKMQGGTIHSSMAMPHIDFDHYYATGGLVGFAEHYSIESPGGNSQTTKIPAVLNSFANAKFTMQDNGHGQNSTYGAGGLVGDGKDLKMWNCYSHLYENLSATNSNFKLLVANKENAEIKNCYGFDSDYEYCEPNNDNLVDCEKYTPVISANELGYMYADNKIIGDTALFMRLNRNVWAENKKVEDSLYAHWARPALAEINGDLPVPLLCEFDNMDEGETVKFQGSFRSVGTYAGGHALQYSGPVRDDAGNTPDYNYLGGVEANGTGGNPELDGALVREGTGDYLFIYGDIVNAPTQAVKAAKVSIYEHASIKHSGTLANYDNTYVGITFDNSYGDANSTWGVNYGLVDYGPYPLPRDWHMFSTPLSNAPLGFDYKGTNAPQVDPENPENNHISFDDVNNDDAGYFNNPWHSNKEFSWLNKEGSPLNVAGSPECASEASHRYWMDANKDGYFPMYRGALFSSSVPEHLNEPKTDEWSSLFIIGSDECPSLGNNRYPYGMDLYTWTEPDYHWINFKRNGPNHWHTDELFPDNHHHYHIVYTPAEGRDANKNEDDLIVGRGYMASIAVPTMLQSHGTLNAGDKSIPLTKTATSKLHGWNLVGNPYHGYLDFDALGNYSTNSAVLSKENGVPFYVIYDADKFTGKAETAYRYYPMSGSKEGEYADQYLHPHQGFYVKAGDLTTTNNLIFTEDMIVTRNSLRTNADGHFRGSSWDDDRPTYPLVNLYLSSHNGCADVTVIEFERPEWSGALKMKELRQGNGLFYAQHDNTHYAALFTEKGAERVPLWFEAKEDDIFTIKWKTANGDFLSMYLVDNLTGSTYDMLANDSYTFQGHVGDYPSRFYIVFKLYEEPDDPEEPEEPEGEGSSFVFFDGSEWVVTGDGMLDFIDVQGRILWHSRLSGGQSRVSVPLVAAGVYMFRLTNGEEVKMQKVIVTNY